MDLKIFNFLVAVAILPFLHATNEGNMTFFKDQKLQTAYFTNFTAPNFYVCNQVCQQCSRCGSISFDNTTNVCELHEESSKGASIVAATGYVFADLLTWPSSAMGTCSSRPCNQSQICMMLTQTSHKCLDVSF